MHHHKKKKNQNPLFLKKKYHTFSGVEGELKFERRITSPLDSNIQEKISFSDFEDVATPTIPNQIPFVQPDFINLQQRMQETDKKPKKGKKGKKRSKTKTKKKKKGKTTTPQMNRILLWGGGVQPAKKKGGKSSKGIVSESSSASQSVRDGDLMAQKLRNLRFANNYLKKSSKENFKETPLNFQPGSKSAQSPSTPITPKSPFTDHVLFNELLLKKVTSEDDRVFYRKLSNDKKQELLEEWVKLESPLENVSVEIPFKNKTRSVKSMIIDLMNFSKDNKSDEHRLYVLTNLNNSILCDDRKKTWINGLIKSEGLDLLFLHFTHYVNEISNKTESEWQILENFLVVLGKILDDPYRSKSTSKSQKNEQLQEEEEEDEEENLGESEHTNITTDLIIEVSKKYLENFIVDLLTCLFRVQKSFFAPLSIIIYLVTNGERKFQKSNYKRLIQLVSRRKFHEILSLKDLIGNTELQESSTGPLRKQFFKRLIDEFLTREDELEAKCTIIRFFLTIVQKSTTDILRYKIVKSFHEELTFALREPIHELMKKNSEMDSKGRRLRRDLGRGMTSLNNVLLKFRNAKERRRLGRTYRDGLREVRAELGGLREAWVDIDKCFYKDIQEFENKFRSRRSITMHQLKKKLMTMKFDFRNLRRIGGEFRTKIYQAIGKMKKFEVIIVDAFRSIGRIHQEKTSIIWKVQKLGMFPASLSLSSLDEVREEISQAREASRAARADFITSLMDMRDFVGGSEKVSALTELPCIHLGLRYEEDKRNNYSNIYIGEMDYRRQLEDVGDEVKIQVHEEEEEEEEVEVEDLEDEDFVLIDGPTNINKNYNSKKKRKKKKKKKKKSEEKIPNGYGMLLRRHFQTLIPIRNESLTLIYDGLFKNGLKHGKGVEYTSSGQMEYEGQFFNGQREGRGIIYKSGKKFTEGEFINGDLESEKQTVDFEQFDYRNFKRQLNPSNLIGAGGNGSIYKIKHKRVKYAAKIFHLNNIPRRLRTEYIRRIRASLRICASFCHPNIIPIFGMIVGSKNIGFFMERMNDSVDGFIDKNKGKISMEEKLHILRCTALGQEHLHDQKIINRDLKWGNVLKKGDTIKLTDFDTAKEDESGWKFNVVHTVVGIGTSYFIAPEMLTGKYGLKVDVFAFGLMIFCLWAECRNPYIYNKRCNCGMDLHHLFKNPKMADSQLPRHVKSCRLRPNVDVIVPKSERSEDMNFLVDLMMVCWKGNPNRRPTFEKICDILDKYIRKRTIKKQKLAKNILINEPPKKPSSMNKINPFKKKNKKKNKKQKNRRGSGSDVVVVVEKKINTSSPLETTESRERKNSQNEGYYQYQDIVPFRVMGDPKNREDRILINEWKFDQLILQVTEKFPKSKLLKLFFEVILGEEEEELEEENEKKEELEEENMNKKKKKKKNKRLFWIRNDEQLKLLLQQHEYLTLIAEFEEIPSVFTPTILGGAGEAEEDLLDMGEAEGGFGMAALEMALARKEIESFKFKLVKKDERIRKLESRLKNLEMESRNREVSRLEFRVQDLEGTNRGLRIKAQERKKLIKEQEKTITMQTVQIQLLKEELESLDLLFEEGLNSRSTNENKKFEKND